MKYQGRAITYTVKNTFYDTDILIVKMPYNPFKALSGYYSSYWKMLKNNGIEQSNGEAHQVKVTKIITKEKTNRTVYTFECGVVINTPADATEYDYEILYAQLNVFKMSCKK